MTTIMVVDDEALVRETLRQMLMSDGFDVVEAGNGNEALRAIEGTPVDLVITDLIMPEKEGIETIFEVMRRRPGLKVIAISGGSRTGNFDYLALARRIGAFRVLAKPFRAAELREAVNAALAESD